MQRCTLCPTRDSWIHLYLEYPKASRCILMYPEEMAMTHQDTSHGSLQLLQREVPRAEVVEGPRQPRHQWQPLCNPPAPNCPRQRHQRSASVAIRESHASGYMYMIPSMYPEYRDASSMYRGTYLHKF